MAYKVFGKPAEAGWTELLDAGHHQLKLVASHGLKDTSWHAQTRLSGLKDAALGSKLPLAHQPSMSPLRALNSLVWNGPVGLQAAGWNRSESTYTGY